MNGICKVKQLGLSGRIPKVVFYLELINSYRTADIQVNTL
jgi:hypothetical protein